MEEEKARLDEEKRVREEARKVEEEKSRFLALSDREKVRSHPLVLIIYKLD